MPVFEYYLPRPPFELTPAMQSAFDELFLATLPGSEIDYRLPFSKWQFLSYLCDSRELVLHGSQTPGIEVVEPRQANDVKAYSNQRAIYATTDGIWVIYFAIIDRKKYSPLSLFNSCFRVGPTLEQLSDPLYFFSITHSARLQNPWCQGLIYILPRQSFQREPAQVFEGFQVVFPHWISLQACQPAAVLRVDAKDFPFLEQIHGHDDEKLSRLAAADPNGFPWPEALLT